MKKLLILLLVLVVAGGVFAQELKWSGGVMFGLGLSSNAKSAPAINDENWWWGGYGGKTTGGDSWGSAAAGQVEANYSQDNARVTLRVRSFFTNINSYDIGVPLAKVEFDLLDKIIGIRAGRLDEGLWNTQVADWWQVTNGVGALLEIKPIEGLSFGGILKTDGVKGGVKNTEELFKRAAFGVSYNNASLLYVSAAFQLADGRGADIPDPADKDKTLPGDLSKANFALYGLNINAVPNLILKTEGKFSNIGAGKDAAGKDIAIKTELRQDIGYNIIPGTFKAVLRVKENLADTTGLVLMPYAEYVINSTFTGYIEVEASIANLDDTSKIGIYIKPKLTYNIAPGASIIGYYKATIPADGADPVHQLQLSFSSTF
jgi:hypothetical protein